MELIGYAASISQLAVYLASSAVSLKRLYTELRNGDSTYRNEATNIQLLLSIFQRLRDQTFENHDPVLPVLIAISGLATELLHLLQPRKKFGINWAPITSQDKISSAFESLDKKRTLLHLYISQAHHTALVDLRETIDKATMTAPSRSFTESTTESIVSPGNTVSTGATGASTTINQTGTTGAPEALPPNQKPRAVTIEGIDVDGVNSNMTGQPTPGQPLGDVSIKNIKVVGVNEAGVGDKAPLDHNELQKNLLEQKRVAHKAVQPSVVPGAAAQVSKAWGERRVLGSLSAEGKRQ